MVRPCIDLGQLSQWGVAVVLTVVASSAPAKAVPVGSVPAATVVFCHSTETRLPTPSELESLQALLLKYKVAVPDVAIDKTALTRCQFASRLYALLNQVNEVIAAGNFELVAEADLKADLVVFKQLQAAYATELDYYLPESRLEARTATLEKQQFSTTTKLTSGEGMSVVDFEAGYRQALTEAAALALFRGQVDDPVKVSKLITLQPSTTTKLSGASFLSPQPVPLSFSLDALSTSTKPPAPRTFAPTTTLHVETVLELSGTAGNR